MKNYSSIFFLLLLLLSVSCQKDLTEEPVVQNRVVAEGGTAQNSSIAEAPSISMIVSAGNAPITIGERFINAYILENMRMGLTNMKLRGVYDPDDHRVTTASDLWSMSGEDINTSHYYIKITPQNIDELLELRSNPSLVLNPVPYDAKISGAGVIQRAPAAYDPGTGILSVSGSLIPQYAVISILDPLPANCTILEKLYIPEEITPKIAAAARTPMLTPDAASLLTDNSLYHSGAKFRQELMEEKRWQPSGTVRVFDNSLSRYVGVPHVRVHIYNGVSKTYVYTNADGDFESAKYFKGAVSYYIEWATDDYYVLNSAGEPSYLYCRANSYSNLHIDIKDGEQHGIANTCRALAAHYYGKNDWERATDYDSYKGVRVPIYYRYEAHPEYAGYFQYPEGRKKLHIAIYGKTQNSNGSIVDQDARSLLSTTFHEMGHASMYFRGWYDYSYETLSRKMFRESWASFVGWILVNDEYSRRGIDINPKDYKVLNPNGTFFDFPSHFNKQAFSMDVLLDKTTIYRYYTPLLIDILDDSNQFDYYFLKGSKSIVPNDRIKSNNYPLLKKIFLRPQGVYGLEEQLLNNADALGIQRQDIIDYFAFYKTAPL